MKPRIVFLILAVLFLMSACNSQDVSVQQDEIVQNTTYTHNTTSISRSGETLLQLLIASPCVFEGTCLKKQAAPDSGPSTLVDVQVETVWRGTITEGNTVSVSTMVPNLFPIGQHCLIFAEPRDNIFWQMSFYASNSVLYRNGDTVNQNVIVGVNDMSYEDVIRLIEDYTVEHPDVKESIVEGAYCKSDDLREIYDYSPFVLEVIPEVIVYNELSDRTTYRCQVNETLKGESDDSVLIISFKDSMEIGNSYLVLLQLPQESSVFIPSALRSVFPADSEEAELIRSFQ